ncbi:MAG: putative peptidoglycan glycosyltransferase FtsW [Anaerolineaceae bacterium]|nr:putative peptidoglycan glycosyltransferase FtsW [Anaerolineaceae bacterium]
MGDGTFVKPLRQKTTSGSQHPLRLSIDVPLLLVVTTLLVFGLLMVYSASWDYSMMMDKAPTYIFFRQVRWAVIGLVIAAALAWFDYRRLRRLLVPMMLGTMALLVVVLWINDVRLGAARSILGGSIQPSELAKVATIVYLAFWLSSKQNQLNNISFGLFPMGAILGAMGGLVLLQPDISAAGTVFLMGVFLFFLAGGEWRQIIFVFVAALIAGFIVVKLSTTGNSRLTSYLEGLRDPIQASYHVRRSLEAVVKGGWFGVGIGQAETKFTGLPVAPTDSIFAVIAEETGLLGAGLVVILYGVLLWRGLTIARRAPDQLGSLLAAGLTLWITLEAIINMAVIVGLMPFAGNALPFISAGGSNMTASLGAVGLLMSISRRSTEGETKEGRPFSAVVNLRWRDWGRSVSRSRRIANTRGRS